MKAMICLACVAIAATGGGKMIFAKPAIPIAQPPPKLVKTENIRIVENTPFKVRWEPLYYGSQPSQERIEPKDNIVRSIPIKQPRDLSMYPAKEPELREPVRSPQRRMVNIRYASGGEKATCARVGWRTVYTNGGRSWRCRK